MLTENILHYLWKITKSYVCTKPKSALWPQSTVSLFKPKNLPWWAYACDTSNYNGHKQLWVLVVGKWKSGLINSSLTTVKILLRSCLKKYCLEENWFSTEFHSEPRIQRLGLIGF